MNILEDIKVIVESLKKKGFNAEFASSRYRAKEMMLEMIPLDAVVGVADSVTLSQVNVFLGSVSCCIEEERLRA